MGGCSKLLQIKRHAFGDDRLRGQTKRICKVAESSFAAKRYSRVDWFELARNGVALAAHADSAEL